MDVTSLLNSNPATAEQRKRANSGSSRAPSRNRTPWDAGGYSLPINTATHGARSPQQQIQPEIRYDDAPISTPPPSPKHRFSDSRSSLSSYTSSLQSATTHSRYSSTSTLNSNSHAHHKSFGNDVLSLEIRSIPQTLEKASQPLAIDSSQATGRQRRTSLSPVGSPLEQLALVAESRLSGPRADLISRNDDLMETAASSLALENPLEIPPYNRPGSPSDAILIKRTSIPSLRVNTEDLDGDQQQNYLSAPLHFQPSHLHNKFHKRTLSAPNFRQSTTSPLVLSPIPQSHFIPSYINASTPMEEAPGSERKSLAKFSLSISASPVVSNTLSSKNSLQQDSLNSNSLISNESLAAQNSLVSNTYQYIPNRSDIALSSSRLAINSSLVPTAEPTPPSSQHPDHASPTSPPTYRTSSTPPIIGQDNINKPITCEFVDNCDTGSQMRKAISHIFGRNKMCTRQIPQKVWVHFCRKHYQRSRYRNPKEYAKTQCQLVQKQIRQISEWYETQRRGLADGPLTWSLAVRKREQKRIQDLEKKESNKRKRSNVNIDDDEDEEEDFGPGHEPLTAVPRWLHAQCRGGYTTAEVLSIFNTLQREIWSGQHTNTFPDLEILPELDPVAKEPKSPKGYTKRPSAPPAHRRSQSLGVPSIHTPVWDGEEPSMHDSPSQKRRRSNVGSEYEEFGRDSYQYPARPRGARPMEGMGRMQNLVHRPMYTHPEEYSDHQPRNSYAPYSPSTFQAPLPAPTPLRNTGYPLASHLENGGDYRRPMHSRSQSDYAFHGHPAYPRSPTGYHPSNMEVRPGYGHHIGHHVGMGHQIGHHMGVGRQMHHSPHPESAYEPYTPHTPHNPHMSDLRAHHPGHGRHQSTPMMYSSSYAPSTQRSTLPAPHVVEDEKTHTIYSERR